MNFPKNLTSILSLSLVFAIAVVVISPASANLFGPMSSESPDAVTHGANHHGMANASFQKEHLQEQLTRLGTTGIDVTIPQADLAAGNTAAALQWLAAYHEDHPGMFANTTRPQPGNETFQKERLLDQITRLGTTGIDVTVPQADLAAGNTAAALQWLAAYHEDHPGMAGNMTGRQPGNSTSWKGNFSFAGHHAGSTGKRAGNQTGFPHQAQETASAA